ncbi:hypothetical protein AYO20_06216 [Fonsecaea nubica]|uniref:Uncharacterized protein n=1 Tax=Fonsecaea nubica TaxID=856822 RepID=A0A178CYM5_9EURO|nr:hypothetical protein AYO20_06216 [Fonsecaea nubica]OAL34586.1 hypothetical protein AYO20_06216 [Fonsecaea nubica]
MAGLAVRPRVIRGEPFETHGPRPFRERQAIYVMELEKRLQIAEKPETSRMVALEEENRVLRDQLLECRKKLRSIQASLEGVSADITGVLYEKLGSDVDKSELDVAGDGEADKCTGDPVYSHRLDFGCDVQQVDSSLISPTTDITLPQTNNRISDLGPVEIIRRNEDPTTLLDISSTLFPDLFIDLASSGNGLGCFQQIDSGKEVCLVHQSSANTEFHLNSSEAILSGANSSYSAHIIAFESCIKRKWNELKHQLYDDMNSLRSSVDLMLSAFVCSMWPPMMSFYTYTGAHIRLGKLTMWRINANPETYADLDLSYRPSLLQQSSLHAAIIDWIPFPSLRDRILLAYTDEHLDRLVCDIGDSYVIQVDLSKLVRGFTPKLGYIGLWDLLTVAASQSTPIEDSPFPSTLTDINIKEYTDPPTWQSINNKFKEYCLPAPSLEALFTSPEYALAAYRSFDFQRDPSLLRLDPTFYQKYPELHDAQTTLIARGTPLRRPDRPSWPLPPTMTTPMMQRYNSIATWAFDCAIEKLRR